MEHFKARRLPPDTILYRGLEKAGWIDKTVDPWGITLGAFFRRAKDGEGLSVVFRPEDCFNLKIHQIARITVAQVESTIADPATGQMLEVWQDEPEHAFIANLPFHSENQELANDIATLLADQAEVLSAEDFEAAKSKRETNEPEPGTTPEIVPHRPATNETPPPS